MSVENLKRVLFTPIPGPRSRALQDAREREVSRALGTTLPIFIDRAEGAILIDVDGNQLIDLASGIAVNAVGAANPSVAKSVATQVRRFTHTCFLVTEYEGFVDLAARLNRLVPGEFEKKTALFTTGAEAVENAIKIARTATGRSAVVALGHAYHGRTLLTMSLTGKHEPYRKGFGPLAPEIYRVPSPYPYRWPSGPEHSGPEALAILRDTIHTQIGATDVAAIIVEPIQGEGGVIVPPPGYLRGVQDFARDHGIVFIADEIQTGFGRTGAMFACEHEGVEPDLITTAKALGGGLPIAAVSGRADLMDSVAPGGLGGTFAGNPVACAAGLAALDVIERDGLVDRARLIENLSMPRLRELVDRSDIVGEVRGRGAMLAIEFVRPRTLEPFADAARAVAAAAHRQGVIALVCGTYGNVIRILPPLMIPEELLLDGLDVIGRAVYDFAAGSAVEE